MQPTMSTDRASQAETISTGTAPGRYDSDASIGILHFQEGSAKGVAAMAVFMVILAMAEEAPDVVRDALAADGPRRMLLSLFNLGTVREIHGDGSKMDCRIAAAARQNQAAETTPVHSHTWCRLLRDLAPGASDAQGEAAMAEAIKAYNEHPDVVAFRLLGGSGGPGGKRKAPDEDSNLGLDVRRMRNVRNWFLRATPATHALVQESLHAIPFKYGPFDESVWSHDFLWLGSKIDCVDVAGIMTDPVPHETTVSPDWTLPLCPASQLALFARIINAHKVAMLGIPVERGAKVRLPREELLKMRKVVTLWIRYRHLASQEYPADEYNDMNRHMLVTGYLDNEVDAIISARPQQFSWGLLQSRRDKVLDARRQREEVREAACTEAAEAYRAE